jgi:parallel beta-helix repeat protein
VRRGFRLLLVAFVTTLLVLPAVPATASTDPWVMTEDTKLTEDHFGPIVVGADGITLNCAGHSVISQAWDFWGIDLENRSDVTIKNCQLGGFNTAIVLRGSHNNVLSRNSVGGNATGIHLGDSHHNVLSHNLADGARFEGFVLVGSDDNVVRGNTAQGSGRGFFIGGDNNLLVDNASEHTHNGGGFTVGGTGNRLHRNTVINDIKIPPFCCFGINLHGSDNTLTHSTVSGGVHGIGVFDSDHSVISNNTVFDNLWGIKISESTENIIRRNSADGNDEIGFWVQSSSTDNNFHRNSACDNGIVDALVDSSSTPNKWKKNDFCTTDGI